MIYLIAWRNIWRNRGRSLVVIGAMVIGICATIFITGFSLGMYEYRIDDLIKNEESHIQIHDSIYLENKETRFLIKDSDKLIEEISTDPNVEAYAPRLAGMAMLMSSRGQVGAVAMGIDTALENKTTGLEAKLIDGTYFSGTRAKPIIVSKRTLDDLKLDLGQRLTLRIDQFPAVRYKIVGVYETENSVYDETHVFVLDKHLRDQLDLPEGYHEIAVLLKDGDNMFTYQEHLKEISSAGNKVQNWKELVPEVAVGMDSLNQSIMIIVIIIFLGVAFGIVNTMLMAVLERVREIGMLLSIGMTRRRVFSLMIIETMFLSLAGVPIGILIGYTLIETTGKSGIDLSMFSEGFSGLGFSSIVYPSLTLEYYIQITIQILIIVFIASLFPAFRARKLNPAEAIRKL